MAIVVNTHSDTILHDISLKIPQGEHRCIVGANGAGKSTLAKVLCAIRPSKAVSVEGRSLHRLSPSERKEEINYIPPRLEIYDPYLRVRDYLEMSRHSTRFGIDEAMEITGITPLQDHRCLTLSSGEAQLMMTAGALLHDARYTIFDEPAANLDPLHTRRLFGILKDERLFGTRIVITHHLDLAFHLGYDILCMEEGRIVFDGSSEDFFAQEALQRRYHGAIARYANHIVTEFL